MKGELPLLPPSGDFPLHVMAGVTTLGDQVTSSLPPDVEELLGRLQPQILAATVEAHSDVCLTLTCLTVDYRYTVWRATYSLAGRWTLSPVEVVCDTTLFG